MTRLLLLRRWCDALKEFNSLKLFLLIVSGKNYIGKKPDKDEKLPSAIPAVTILSYPIDTLPKRGLHHPFTTAPTDFSSTLSQDLFILPKGKKGCVKKQTTKGKSIENCYKFFPKNRENKSNFFDWTKQGKRSINFCKSFVFVPILLESFAFSGYLKTFLFRSS